MNYEKLFDTSISNNSIESYKSDGKKIMGTICCHVPEEIIHAAGMLPVRIRATDCKDSSEGETWMSSLSCSYARSCLQYLLDGTYDLDGVISSDGCIMASRIFDNWKYIDSSKGKNYLQQIGAPRLLGDLNIEYYKDELFDMKEGLEKYGDLQITDDKLKNSIDLYNKTRSLIRELYELRKVDSPVVSGVDVLKIILSATSLPKEEFNDLLESFLKDAKNRKPITDSRVRLMVIGSALDDPEYMKVIEDTGALVVADALCYGSRYLWEPVEIKDEDMMGSIAESYLTRSVCPRMLDGHDEMHSFIFNMIKEYKVDGVIFQKMQNCECWGGEGVYLNKLMEDENIPMLSVEREQLMANAGQLAIRVEAFVEMIEKEN